jgi:hypothetical protein
MSQSEILERQNQVILILEKFSVMYAVTVPTGFLSAQQK